MRRYLEEKLFDPEVPCPKIPLEENKYDSLSEIELWEAFKIGDEGAFIRIYNTYFEELCDFGVQYASLDMVEDAVQDLFIDLRKRRNRLPRIKNTIRLFLFQCLKRRILNFLKKENKINKGNISGHGFEIIPSHESVIILNQERQIQFEKLDRALAGLNERQREAVYYYFYKGMSYDEVRELIGFKDVKSVRNLIYKVVGTLRKSFLFFFV